MAHDQASTTVDDLNWIRKKNSQKLNYEFTTYSSACRYQLKCMSDYDHLGANNRQRSSSLETADLGISRDRMRFREIADRCIRVRIAYVLRVSYKLKLRLHLFENLMMLSLTFWILIPFQNQYAVLTTFLAQHKSF